MKSTTIILVALLLIAALAVPAVTASDVITFTGTGFAITSEMVYAGCILGIVFMIQPYSRTLRDIGIMGGLVAYAFLPFVLVGFFV